MTYSKALGKASIDTQKINSKEPFKDINVQGKCSNIINL